MSQPNRLAGDLPAEFSAPLIDRDRPIRFSVDGIALEAYEGDTVLSALLANGIVSAGRRAGFPVALDAASAPPVTLEGSSDPMPMALCPVRDGARFHTVGPRQKAVPLTRFLDRRPSSLGHDLDIGRAPGAWIDADPDETVETDFVIVGGGVAGMSAALAAADKPSRVLLVEREAELGGAAVFFGKLEGEKTPDSRVADLAGAIAGRPEITVLRCAEAFGMTDGLLRVVQVVCANGVPRSRHLAIRFAQAVLATGTEERLPIFPGNRLPRVTGALPAWRMARQFGVWIGRTFHLHAATNAGYRMAMLGAQAGKSVVGASDPRPDPRTRFIEFCKAYGFRLGWDARIGVVAPHGNDLAIRLSGHQFGGARHAAPLTAEALIVSGGWQPVLGLWVQAGGQVRWDAERHRLTAVDGPEGIALAGSAAGCLGTQACLESGNAAVALGGIAGPPVIADPQLPEIYESVDGPITVSVPETRRLPRAWLGFSCRSALPEPAPKGLAALVPGRAARTPDQLRPAALSDVTGLIAGKLLPPALADEYCRQWCILPRAFRAAARPEPARLPSVLPDYLAGRFGIGQAQWSLTTQDDRAFDPGCLIFINTDETHPRAAIGVVLSCDRKGCVALMARTEYGEGDTVYIRDGAACTPARLFRKI